MKGKKKQALSMVLALSLSVFTIADGANIASAKAKLTRKTLALTVGQKKKIAIKGKKNTKRRQERWEPLRLQSKARE